jgi:hypothetical protein
MGFRELRHFLRRRREAGEVETHAPDQRRCVRGRHGFQPLLHELGVNKLIHRIAALSLRFWSLDRQRLQTPPIEITRRIILQHARLGPRCARRYPATQRCDLGGRQWLTFLRHLRGGATHLLDQTACVGFARRNHRQHMFASVEFQITFGVRAVVTGEATPLDDGRHVALDVQNRGRENRDGD